MVVIGRVVVTWGGEGKQGRSKSMSEEVGGEDLFPILYHSWDLDFGNGGFSCLILLGKRAGISSA